MVSYLELNDCLVALEITPGPLVYFGDDAKTEAVFLFRGWWIGASTRDIFGPTPLNDQRSGVKSAALRACMSARLSCWSSKAATRGRMIAMA